MRSRIPLATISILLALVPAGTGCGGNGATGEAAETRGVAALQTLFEDYWSFRLDEDPVFADAVGEPRDPTAWPDPRPAAQSRRDAAYAEFESRLAAFDLDALPEPDRSHARVLAYWLEDARSAFRFRTWESPLLSDWGFHADAATLPSRTAFRTREDLERFLVRLEGLPEYFDRHTDNMRDGLARGFTLPRSVLPGIVPSIRAHVVDDPERSVFWSPFEDAPADDALRERARTTIRDSVVPAYRSFLEFFVNEYTPGARTTIAATALPDGEAYYAQRVRHFATLPMTAREIHDLGLREVERIRAEMDAVVTRTGFDGSFAAFLEFLRTDPRFYAESPQRLLERAAWLSKSIDAKLPALIGKLPRLPYGVAPVPDHLAPNFTGGRYVPPAEDTDEPGYYWVNTHALESRPLYVLPALTLHEAVPGHHLQGSLARESGDAPAFRRHDYISAYGEGWALYAEWLGKEIGFYEDPYDEFGRLTYEMWRACRLVVDTGMHAFGWSAERARAYLAERTALSTHEIGTEIDRYIAWPGQALSYKIGELKIREWRARAEDALGDRFDRRTFHDAILASGSVPLGVVEENVDRYIETRRGPRGGS